MGGRTAEVVVALRAWRTIRVGVIHEADPLVRIILSNLVWREPVPHARVDLGHLWAFNDFRLRGWGEVFRSVREERPSGMVRPSAGGRPYHQSSSRGIQAALLQGSCAALENKLLQSFRIFPAGR